MVQRVSTVAFEGIEARAVDVQVQVAPGLPAFAIAECECQYYTAASHGDCNGITELDDPTGPTEHCSPRFGHSTRSGGIGRPREAP
ncbi:hypothetical protein SAMN05216330_1011052 [Bradyrhizobium sp. Ghvi]|nr:hypothetical protein SAMN05216330_1011052 [Bradyrhizobium sp. Ghvi]